MEYEGTSWRLRKLACPNCHKELVGAEGKDGITKVICTRCGTSLASRRISRRHGRIDMYAPKRPRNIE